MYCHVFMVDSVDSRGEASGFRLGV